MPDKLGELEAFPHAEEPALPILLQAALALQGVRSEGDWESWVEFFLAGIEMTADQAVDTARQIQALLDEDRGKLSRLGRPGRSAVQLHAAMQKEPLFTISDLSQATGLSYPAVKRAVELMERLHVIRRFTRVHSSQIFEYQRYMEILAQGTEPLAR